MLSVKVEVCRNNLSRHQMTKDILKRMKEECSSLPFEMEMVENKCGGICTICKTTPYVIVDKKLIPGITPDQFFSKVKSFLDEKSEGLNK